MSQMCAELWALCMGIRLAIHRGWKHLHLVGDNLGALCQLLKLRAGVGFRSQQVILKKVSYLLSRSGLQVWIFWVPTHLMPADPISRYLEGFGGSLSKASKEARKFLATLKANRHEMFYLGRVNEPLSSDEQRKWRDKWMEKWMGGTEDEEVLSQG